jgi:UDP-N-acetylmuramate--alanine ligase
MAAVAELLVAQGVAVSGCDGADSARLRRLGGLGVATCVGHDPGHLAGVDRVVFSSAIRADNPELVAARAAPNLVVEHRAEALARIANARRLVAVAGAHGKTTTSAMAVAVLEAGGLEPSYAIGSELVGRGSGARLGTGSVMVIEADESDGSFLGYRPEVAVVTNVEPDHLDHYGAEEALVEAFREFVARTLPGGVLIACAVDPGALALAEWARAAGLDLAIWLYGAAGGQPGGADGVGRGDGGEVADPRPSGPPGRHMALNARAAQLVGEWFGVAPALARAGLAGFAGTARRFESRGEARGVRVFDDYAHHPTEVAATLAAARDVAGQGRLLVVFQPHLYSRTARFQAEFAEALGGADRVWLMDVYGAREAPLPGVSSALIARRMEATKAERAPDRGVIGAAVARAARPGDLVFTMGAGDVTELGDEILRELRR